MKNQLNLKFTGKMTILIELEEYGPIQYNVNDLLIVSDVMEIILDAADNKTSLDSYNKREQKSMQKLLDNIT